MISLLLCFCLSLTNAQGRKTGFTYGEFRSLVRAATNQTYILGANEMEGRSFSIYFTNQVDMKAFIAGNKK